MLIVSGQIFVAAGQRDAFLAATRQAIVLARAAAGCRDFVVAADPLDESRVNSTKKGTQRKSWKPSAGAARTTTSPA